MLQRKRNKSFFSFLKKPTLNNFQRRIVKLKNPAALPIIGLSLFFFGLAHQIQAVPLSFEGPLPQNIVIGINPPVNVTIPSISVSLPVDQSVIRNGIWEVSENGISHLATSSNPGVRGNIIMYGHNTDERLGALDEVKMGDEINLRTENGSVYSYKVTSIMIVNPSEIQKLTEYQDQTLTIYTCTGFADLKRLLVKAQRVNSLKLRF